MRMRLNDEETQFRIEMREFFTTKIPADIRERSAANAVREPDDIVAVQRILNEHGYAVPAWPKEWGGQDWTATQKHIFLDEMHMARVPEPLTFNIDMAGPVIAQFGSEEQKQRFLPATANLDVWWCQGFSEPGAGSDLASLRTQAVIDQDHFIVNGQKMWTTMAQHADWMFALVRTDPTAKKRQAGIRLILIVAEFGYPERISEFTVGLIRLCDVDPDVVFVVGAGSDLGPMIRSARDLGVDAEIVGFSSLFTSETIRTDGDLLGNVTGFFYTPQHAAADSDSEFLANLMTCYKEEYGEWPYGLALQGYQGILVIAEALRNLDGEPSTESLIAAFESIKDFDTGIFRPMTVGEGDRQGATEDVLMKLLPGCEETTSLWANVEMLAA